MYFDNMLRQRFSQKIWNRIFKFAKKVLAHKH